jgi:hypothetical protein
MSKYRRLFLQILILPILPVFAKGPDPDDFNEPTEVEKAQSENAARMFNLALEGKPVTDAYLADTTADPAERTNAVQGQAAVDMAKMTPQVSNPNQVNQGMNPAGASTLATQRAKVMSDVAQDAQGQQAAGMKSAVENALGVQSSANTAMAGMARDAVDRNTTKAASDYNSRVTTNSSIASLAGAGTGMAMSYKKEPK